MKVLSKVIVSVAAAAVGASIYGLARLVRLVKMTEFEAITPAAPEEEPVAIVEPPLAKAKPGKKASKPKAKAKATKVVAELQTMAVEVKQETGRKARVEKFKSFINGNKSNGNKSPVAV